MIKKFNDYEQTRAYTDGQSLPRGGYVCKIIGAKPQDSQFGQSIKIAFDIVEGEYSGYYQKKFDGNTNEDRKWPGTFLLNVPRDDGSERDGWTKRSFRTFTDALEDSNPGYHFDWDEAKFKGKMIGFVFNYREWTAPDGREVMSPNAARATTIDKIRKGDFKIPKDKLLPGHTDAGTSASTPEYAGSDDMLNIPPGTDEEVPF
jgi:hypothetical protein